MSTGWKRARTSVAFTLTALVGVYGVAGMIGGAIPTNTAWVAPDAGVTIFVESNGVHTGLLLPVMTGGVDWRDLARAEDIADPRYTAHPYVAIGWGDRSFYLETPHWSDVRVGTVLAAAVGSDRTVLHVEHIAQPVAGPDVRRIVLRPTEYRRLAAFVRASFRLTDGRTAHQYGYGRDDAFYDANGRYSAIATCNAWTGDALRQAGVRVGAWTPFPVTVLGWFQ